MTSLELCKKFISLNDEQKLAVISTLDNIKETPAEILSGLRWLYEMSKTETAEKMFEEYIESLN